MEEISPQQFFNLLLVLAKSTPRKMAKKLGVSKSTVERWIRDTSVNTKDLGQISEMAKIEILIQVGWKTYPVQSFGTYIPYLHETLKLTTEASSQ